MALADIVQLVGLAVALIIGFWNMRNSASVSVPQNMLNLNTAISLANKRALEAETLTDELSKEFHLYKKESSTIIEALNKQIELLTSAMAYRYRMIFDIVGELGKDVTITNAEIHPIEDRRKEDRPVEVDRRVV